jgi:hypothetical protein
MQKTQYTTMSMANTMRMTTKQKSKLMTALLPIAKQITVASFSSSSQHQNHHQSAYTPLQRYQQQQQPQHIPIQERAYHNHHRSSSSSSSSSSAAAIAHVTKTSSFCKDGIVVDPYLGNLSNGFCNGLVPGQTM